MAGTINGGRAAAATNKRKYGESFYKRIGALGGANSGTGGFYKDKERAKIAGALGGTRSKRGYKLVDGEYVKNAEPRKWWDIITKGNK